MLVFLVYNSLTFIFSLHCILSIPKEWIEKIFTNHNTISAKNKFWTRRICLVASNLEQLCSDSPVQGILSREVCMDETKKWSVTLLLEIMDSLLSLKM